MKALDLFGGRDEIYRRMNAAFAEKAKTLPEDDLKFWQEVLFDPDGIDLANFDPSVDQISWEDFQKMNGPLDLSIWDILGEADFSTEGSLEYWESQVVDSPFIVFGVPEAKIELKMYVGLRATEEMSLGEADD